MTAASLGFRYVLFAALATGVNLGSQHAMLWLGSGLAAAMAAGTATGLMAKYLLDKRWIFADRSTGWGNFSRSFGLYTMMGVVSTVLFWGTELAFARAFDGAVMRDVGAVLGLALGYATKYQLDRRFVFVERQA